MCEASHPVGSFIGWQVWGRGGRGGGGLVRMGKKHFGHFFISREKIVIELFLLHTDLVIHKYFLNYPR